MKATSPPSPPTSPTSQRTRRALGLSSLSRNDCQPDSPQPGAGPSPRTRASIAQMSARQFSQALQRNPNLLGRQQHDEVVERQPGQLHPFSVPPAKEE